MKFRILLVDDSEDNHLLVRAYLKDTAYAVETAENGRVGVEMCAKERFDLILMDVQMPEMDGYAATRAIRERENKEGTHTPIVALTSFALKQERDASAAAGCDAHLTKPVNRAELLEAIAKLIS